MLQSTMQLVLNYPNYFFQFLEQNSVIQLHLAKVPKMEKLF